MRNGWIKEVTHDPSFKAKLISGVFCIPKSDGTPRLIFDGRAMNEYLGNKKFVLPEPQAPLRQKFNRVAKLDLSNAFMHFKVDKKLQEYQCFSFEDKIYSYTRLTWGTSIAPYVLQSFMTAICEYVMVQTTATVMVYMDDFCITGMSNREVNLALKILRMTLSKVGFQINNEKSSPCAQTEIDWLGFKLSANTLKLDEKK